MEAAKRLSTGLLLAGVLMMSFLPPSAAYVFVVGGRAGWVQSPAVPYNNWAGAMRFQVNDSLVFKYKKGDDSVLVVDNSGYDSCNTSGPVEKLDGGDSVYKLPRTGPNYFISGEAGHCGKGQKLIVVVLAIRNKPSPPPPSVAVPPSIATPPSAAVPPSIATPPSAAVPPPVATPPSLAPSDETPTPLSAPTSSPAEAPVVSSPPGATGPPGSGLPPLSAPPPAGKSASSSSVLRVSGVTVGMAAVLLGGVLFG